MTNVMDGVKYKISSKIKGAPPDSSFLWRLHTCDNPIKNHNNETLKGMQAFDWRLPIHI